MSTEDNKLTNDMVIKQECLATECGEKSLSTQVPTEPRKPAQEQTRTENLQRIQQRKLKIYKLPKPQKMAKLSMYSVFQKCRCMGWKTQEENRHRDVESNYCPKFSEECRNAGCKHPLDVGKSLQVIGCKLTMEKLFPPFESKWPWTLHIVVDFILLVYAIIVFYSSVVNLKITGITCFILICGLASGLPDDYKYRNSGTVRLALTFAMKIVSPVVGMFLIDEERIVLVLLIIVVVSELLLACIIVITVVRQYKANQLQPESTAVETMV